MKIAIVGWGYLTWDPRSLDLEPEWHADGPLLPVEFARFSGGSVLTPVLVEDVPLQPTLWTRSRKASVLSAADDLAVREGVWDDDIGHWSRTEAMRAPSGIEAVIAQWAESKGLDGAVWRAVEPNLPDMTPGMSSELLRLDYLRGLVTAGRATNARQYFQRTPAQIATPFRRRVRCELGW